MLENETRKMEEKLNLVKCKNIIISGGIKDPLEGQALRGKIKTNSVFGMAQALLPFAQQDYDSLRNYLIQLRRTLQFEQTRLPVAVGAHPS